jgi:hypothetical protein
VNVGIRTKKAALIENSSDSRAVNEDSKVINLEKEKIERI